MGFCTFGGGQKNPLKIIGLHDFMGFTGHKIEPDFMRKIIYFQHFMGVFGVWRFFAFCRSDGYSERLGFFVLFFGSADVGLDKNLGEVGADGYSVPTVVL